MGGSRRGRAAVAAPTRRSARTSAMNANGKREGSSDSGLWRGERRSTRLGGPDVSLDVEPARKRARTEESIDSAQSTEGPSSNHGKTNGVRVKTSGAAALKPTEIAMEQIAGKKKSKFWVYAVEPIPGVNPSPPDPSQDLTPPMSDADGHTANGDPLYHDAHLQVANGQSTKSEHDKILEGSLSPMYST